MRTPKSVYSNSPAPGLSRDTRRGGEGPVEFFAVWRDLRTVAAAGAGAAFPVRVAAREALERFRERAVGGAEVGNTAPIRLLHLMTVRRLVKRKTT